MNLDHQFKALADPTRTRLMHLLLHYELNVNEMTAILRTGQSRVSHHLKVLVNSGLVRQRRQGLWSFYSAAESGNGNEFLNTIRPLLQGDPDLSGDLQGAQHVINQRNSESTRFFDNIAEDWDSMRSEIFGDINLEQLILQHLPPVDTIVDLGCGAGDLIPILKQRANHVIGVDNSPRMLEAAHRRFQEKPGSVDLRIGGLCHLPLRDGEADLCVIHMVLHHLETPDAVLEEVHRILKPGDRLIIVDFLPHHRIDMQRRYGDRWMGFEPARIREWLTESGFAPGKMDQFDLKQGLAGFLLPARRI